MYFFNLPLKILDKNLLPSVLTSVSLEMYHSLSTGMLRFAKCKNSPSKAATFANVFRNMHSLC